MKRFAVLAAAACLSACALTGTGRAGSITYTETFTASGTLGTLGSFTNAQVTITGTGDTANVIPSGVDFFNSVTATVTVKGLGTATVTDTIYALDEPGFTPAMAGFSDPTTFSFIETKNSFFTNYALTTPIQPPVSGPLDQHTHNGINTDEGLLTFTSLGSTSTFGAVPEPASLTMLGVGAAGLLGYGWRRRRRAAA
jgi:hypothetical protein